ncbi:hypothetical protein IX51_06470 [uncultured archaeon]|nr:hypothetical protein IX51_06470 [uncultured archaeon]
MLKAELDVEVIKSALLAGEVDDAADWIRKAMHRIEIYRRVTKKSKYDARYRFLESLMGYLSGDFRLDELRKNIEKIPGVRDMFVDPEEFRTFLDSFLYYVQLSADRYNIRYPSFDGKRCDDK